MTAPIISATLIVRDEAELLRPCLESIRPHVDEIVVVDTGSMDNSMQVAREYADRVELFLGCNNPQTNLIEDFSAARNRALELASGDHLFWCDADDIVVGAENLRKLAESRPADIDLCHWVARYDYQFDGDGNVVVEHHRERLAFPRHRHVWQCPVHEGLMPRMPLEGGPLMAIPTDAFHVVHRAQYSAKRREERRNLRILENYVKRNGEGDIRALFYLGVEQLASCEPGNAGNAMRNLRRYIELVSPEEDESVLAMLYIAKIYRALADEDQAIEWASKALVSRLWSAPYFELAQCCYELAERGIRPFYNYNRCVEFAELGITINPRGQAETIQETNPTAHFRIHEILNVALSRIGKIERALWSCEQGLAGLPRSELLLKAKAIYEKELSGPRISREVEGLVEKYKLTPAAAVIIRATLAGDFAVQLLPRPVDMPGPQLPAPVSFADARTAPEPGKLDVVLFTGAALEPWNPPFLEANGMGGSETMAREMSKRLAALGHRVRVFGHCTPTMEGVFEGVEWRDGSRFRNVECDVLISSRRADAVDDVYGCKAGARILWMHDLFIGENLNMARDLRFDRVFALSNFHKGILKRCYPRMNPAKVVVTRNGINPERFAGTEIRNPRRAVFSSSPDRALKMLMSLWPQIRAEVPDAELHIMYGFGNWRKSAEMYGWDDHLRDINHLESLVKTAPGVIFHDRINQRQLAREFMKSGVMLAPCWFEETFGIAFAEAQAAGLRVVATDRGALPETVGDRGVLVPYGNTLTHAMEPEPGFREAFVKAAVEALTRQEDGGREALVKDAAERFDLDALASDWDRLLTEIHADVSARVVPAFHDVSPEAAE